MSIPSSFKAIPVVVLALLLCLGQDAHAQRQRTKTTTAKTTAARTAKVKTTAKAKTTGRARTAKVSLAGARKTKTSSANGKNLSAAKKAKTTKETRSTTARTSTASKKTTTTAKKTTTTARKTAASTTSAKTTKKSTTRKAASKTSKDKKKLTQAQREEIALARVLGQGEVLVSTTPFNGDAAYPITGLGPIEVKVRKQSTGKLGRMKRVLRWFSPSAERVHLVMVDGEGVATKLNSRPNSPFYRAFNGIMNTLPLRELGHDIINSSGVRNGVFTALLGGAATAVNPIGSVGIFRGLQLMVEGVKRRNVARDESFDATVKWANRQGSKGNYPKLVNAYRHYKVELQKNKPGTQPATLKNFAERLAGHGL